MSVTFTIVGLRMSLDDQLRLNVHNGNARALLALLELPDEDPFGRIRARDLRRRCEAVLSTGYVDVGQKPIRFAGNLICGGRSPGRLDGLLRDLVELCERAGELGVITWG